MKTNSIKLKALGAAIGLVAAGGAIVSMNVNAADFTASAEVANTVAITEGTPLSFGSLAIKGAVSAASASPANAQMTLTLNTDGTTTSVPATPADATNDAKITPISGQTPGVFTATGFSAFQTVTVTSTSTFPISMPHTSGAPSITPLSLTDILVLDSASSDTSIDGASASVQANGDGDLTWTIGGSIATTTVAGTTYEDGTYEATFDMTVNY